MIPSNSAFAEDYLRQALEQQEENLIRQQAINAGIADADVGKPTDLNTLKAKWENRAESRADRAI
ncbi:hypothetical protein KRR23_25920 [Pseudomonas sp. CVAP|uniref:hypothetical protein n=1 Tax=Pseudomonas sp. CVAP\|nr:hypothetical protein [Pseudomonas sp. CVAP\